MFCGKCGNELKDDARFCNKCGTPVMNNSIQNGGNVQQREYVNQTSMKAPNTGKRKIRKFILGGIAMAAVVCVGIYAVCFIRGFMKSEKDSFSEYYGYIGKNYEELPAAFDHEKLYESEAYDHCVAKKEMEVGGVEGILQFSYYIIHDEDAIEGWEIESEEIAGFSWTASEEGSDDVLDALEEMYGEPLFCYEYEDTEELFINYEWYGWKEASDKNYAPQLLVIKESDQCNINWYKEFSAEEDKNCTKPVEIFEEACAKGDVELLEEAVSEYMIEAQDIDRDDIEEGLEEIENVKFEITDIQRLFPGYRVSILHTQTNIAVENLIEIEDAYILTADAENSDDLEEVEFIVVKEDDEWSIIHTRRHN